MVLSIAGGIGLFLLGMLLLTDGLKAFAGDSLRRALLRFTKRPAAAFASGAAVTALVQSSSATTLATIGFVSAGLLTFGQAVGVLYGASLGTTSTGWLVSTLGLKLSIGKLALPFVAAGAVLRLSKRGRWSELGLALAGFGLIFIGIDTLQEGMETLAARIDPALLPSGGFWGPLLLMGVGAAMTVLMQSSSAAVATTMAALHTGAISFEHACALVIGQAVGTTSTALLAAIGASPAARRTAAAHVGFNLGSGLIAAALLPIFLRGIAWLQEHAGLAPGAVSLAAFHTSFILLGVLIYLPLTNRFVALIERLVPEKAEEGATRHYDESLLGVPSVALETVRQATREMVFKMVKAIAERRAGRADALTMGEVRKAMVHEVQESERFLARIPPVAGDRRAATLRLALLHAIDHLARLANSLPESPRPMKDPASVEAQRLADDALQRIGKCFAPGATLEDVESIAAIAGKLAELRRWHRKELLEATADSATEPAEALERLDAIRWLDTATYHLSRLALYLGPDAALPAPGAAERTLR
jgi:phosphate:Na+ symporter